MGKWWVLAALGWGLAGWAAEDKGPKPTAEAQVVGTQGEKLGTVRLSQLAEGVLVQVDLEGLPPGEHGFHVHETGKCQPPFTSAGGHLNPTSKQHGFADSGGYHTGDLPNLMVPQSGKVSVELFSPRLSLSAQGGVFDRDGAAIVVHALPDDYSTDPAGAAGDRIACGVVKKVR